MNTGTQYGGNSGFLIGLITGGAIGVALAVAFAPRASELRRRAIASASDLKDAAAQGYQEASAHFAGVMEGMTAKGQAIRDDVADAVGRRAHEVEQYAMASKTVPGAKRS